jgi:hypothetical protein
LAGVGRIVCNDSVGLVSHLVASVIIDTRTLRIYVQLLPWRADKYKLVEAYIRDACNGTKWRIVTILLPCYIYVTRFSFLRNLVTEM